MYEAWKQQDHVSLFSLWDQFSTSRLVKECRRFNDFQLLQTISGSQDCVTLADVGCATGGFYRFFHHLAPNLEYLGFDISEAAVAHAKSIYPSGDFRLFDGNLKSLDTFKSDIVFCRDVVHHQTNPIEFLSDLYDATGRYLVLRVRTREKGNTIFDVDQSCQYTYGRWVPYIVFNTTELIELIGSFQPSPAQMIIRRHPVVLGGQNSRLLPKELYYPETGTAETAVLIKKGDGEGAGSPVVQVETRSEDYQESSLYRLLRRAARKWA